jgi:hypothetical protein
LAKIIDNDGFGGMLNLGYRTSGNSVMRQGWNLGWSNYDRPQALDRTDLSSYYSILYY